MLDPPSLAESFGSTSSTLLERAKARDPLAWSRLVDLYSPLVYHWCRSARLQPADAADLLQEVFHAVSRALAAFDHERQQSSFRGWLRTIARNKLRDHFRRVRRTPRAPADQQPFDQLADQWLDEWDDSTRDDPQHLLMQQALELLRLEFDQSTWQAFWSVTIDDQSPVDVAATLGMSVNSVYKAKSRVLARLRTELGDLLD